MGTALSSPVAPANAAHVRGKLSWQCLPLNEASCRALSDEWESLAGAASEPNVFQFPSYILSSLPLLIEHSVTIVTIREDALLIGLLILRRDTGYAKLPIPFWRSAVHHEQFLGTPLVLAEYEDAFAAGLCTFLDEAPRDCCFINLSMIGADGAVASALKEHCKASGRKLLITNTIKRAAIVPHKNPGTCADDLLRPSRRKSLKRVMTRLAKEGEVVIERLEHASDLEGWTSQFLALEDSGWKRENRSSILSSKAETALYKDLIARAFEDANLHFTRLTLNGIPIGFTLDILAEPLGFCLKSAIDEGHRKFSPGVLLEVETLRHYLGQEEFSLIDSCSAADNAMLNEMWPDRTGVQDMVLARKGGVYDAVFLAVEKTKAILKTAVRA